MSDNQFDENTWFGVGVKTGFMLIGLGYEQTNGMVCNMSNLSRLHGFTAKGLRMGLGFGAATGLVALCVFNCPNIYQMQGGPKGDWGVNVALAGDWDAVVKGLGQYKFFKSVFRIGKKMNLNKGDVQNVRDGLHHMYNNLDLAKTGYSTPKYMCLEVPFGGIGAEVSGYASVSHFYIN